MAISLGAPGGVRDGDGVEKQPPRIVTISEPGYYRMGDAVHTISCPNSKFTIVDCSGMGSLLERSVYAPAAKESQWIYVTSDMLVAGPLQFEVTCSEGANESQLLWRDPGKKNMDEAIGEVGSGVAAQAAMASGYGVRSRVRGSSYDGDDY